MPVERITAVAMAKGQEFQKATLVSRCFCSGRVTMEANASCGATACRLNKYQIVVVVGRDGKGRKRVGAAEMRKERDGKEEVVQKVQLRV